MSLPPVPETPDELDDRYRRMSERDSSRPGETVRRRVLEHAAQLAAQRAGKAASAAKGPSGWQWPSRRWRPAAVFGTLAVAAIAGLMIAPRILVSPVTPKSRPLSAPPVETELRENKAAGRLLPSPAPALEPAPISQSAPIRHEELAAAPPPEAAVAPPSARPARPIAGLHVTQPAAPDATSAERPAQAYLGESAAADSKAAGPRASTSDTATGVTIQEATVTAARRAASAPPAANVAAAPAANVTDAAAALRNAAETGDLRGVDRLLAKQSDINARDAAGRTPLMLAILRGQTDVVSALLAYGADPNAADGHGTTPLQAARAAGRPAIIAALQRYGAR